MSGTGEWPPGLVELAELVGVRVGAWNEFGYAVPEDGQAGIPPLGERSADAIKAGHGAIQAINEMTRELDALREQLVGELRADWDAKEARVDAVLAEPRAGREAGQ